MWICKINLPVVEIGEEHDSAKKEGHEHEEAVDHVEHAVLHEHELEHKHGHNEDDGGYDLDRIGGGYEETFFPAVIFFISWPILIEAMTMAIEEF